MTMYKLDKSSGFVADQRVPVKILIVSGGSDSFSLTSGLAISVSLMHYNKTYLPVQVTCFGTISNHCVAWN